MRRRTLLRPRLTCGVLDLTREGRGDSAAYPNHSATCILPFPVAYGWAGGCMAPDQRQIYRVCYRLLVVTALKLLWDGVSGYLA
jgi:hypothetical protein